MQTRGLFANPQKSGFKRTILYLGASRNWSFGLFAFFFAILSIISLLTDVVRAGQFNPVWFLISGSGFIPPLIVGLIYRYGFLNNRPAKSRVLLNLIVAALAGASRNVSVGILSLIAGLDQELLLSFRFYGGGFMGIAIYVLWAFANGSKFEYLGSLDTLTKTQAKLAQTRQQIPGQLTETKDGLQERTREAIAPQLKLIRDLLGDANNASEALEKLRFTITSQIRPMMAEIASNQPKPFEVRNLKRFKSVKSSLPERFTLRDKINLGWSSFLETIGVSIWVWVYNSPNGVLDNLALFVIYLSVLAFFKFLIPSKKKLPRFNAVFYTLIAASSASLSNVLYIFLVLGFDPGKSVMFAGFALLSGVIGPIILMQLAVRTERRTEIEQQITKDLESLAKENSLFAQRLWVFRKRWLLVLHGSVQSSLTAALTRLQAAQEVTPVLLEMVKQDLHRAESAVNANLHDDLDLSSGLSQLQEVWSGICDVKVQISSRAERAIDRNPDSAFCTNEIIKEAISNAVRHGEATEAKVLVDRKEDDILIIEVTNDGKAVSESGNSGIGSEMLNEVCLKWELLTDKKDRVRLIAELPIQL
jgi:two-component sensor histidine kinase